MSTYTKDGKELQSVTTITGACSDKSGLMKWYAKMPLEWIRENCPIVQCEAHPYSDPCFLVHKDEIEQAIEHPSNEGKRAMGIGSNVHSHIEEFLNARKTSI